MKYVYFISWTFSDGDLTWGSGSGEYPLCHKVTHYSQLSDIAKKIKKQNQLRKVIILNFVLLREEAA